MKPLSLDDEARDEMWHAVDWYEAQRPGLGWDFWTELQKTLDSIREDPSRSSFAPDIPERLCVRRKRTKRFPYAVLYIEHPDETRVVAISHGSQRPGYWRYRLKK